MELKDSINAKERRIKVVWTAFSITNILVFKSTILSSTKKEEAPKGKGGKAGAKTALKPGARKSAF